MDFESYIVQIGLHDQKLHYDKEVTKTMVYIGNTNDVTIITVLTVLGLVEGL